MKYLATVYFPNGMHSEEFPTVREAEGWLDSQNNNLERLTTVQEIDDTGNEVDWFVYTEGQR